MAWKAPITVVAGAVADGFARLVDVAPADMTVFSEDVDWALVGGDFLDAIETVATEDQPVQPPLPFDADALVEAK